MSKGITLIETIIGMAIIFIGVIVIISVFPFGLRTIALNQQGSIATLLASSRVEEIITKDYHGIEEGVKIEDFGEMEGFENLKRETIIDCYETDILSCEDGDTGIKKVTVNVYLDRSEKRKVSLKTLISEK